MDGGVYWGQVSRGGVFKTIDAGANWNDASAGLTVLSFHALAIDPVDAATVYITAGDGLSKSIDSGANWTTVHFPAPFQGTAFVPSLLIDPNNTSVLYASVLASGGCYYTDPFLRKSTDGGATWNDLSVSYCATGPTVSLAMDPSNPNTLYAAPEDGIDCGAYVYGTGDAGENWSQNFIPGAFVTTLAFAPGDPPVLYAAFNGGLSKSTDGARTWVSTTLAGVSNVLALDPKNPEVLYAGTSTGLFKTSDGGATWSQIDTGLAGNMITALAVDSKHSVLYLGTSGTGVFKSVDGGLRWTALNKGLTFLDIQALAVSSDGSSTIYAATTTGGIFRVDGSEMEQPFERRVVAEP